MAVKFSHYQSLAGLNDSLRKLVNTRGSASKAGLPGQARSLQSIPENVAAARARQNWAFAFLILGVQST
jgi:hypothetical protein